MARKWMWCRVRHVFLVLHVLVMVVGVMSGGKMKLPAEAAESGRPTGVLQRNRQFLDFFWDLAKPEQETRLAAVEQLIRYLEHSDQVSGVHTQVLRLSCLSCLSCALQQRVRTDWTDCSLKRDVPQERGLGWH